jgi:hypothetical protein
MSTKKSTKSKDYDYLFKLVLIGDSGVGKSCLLLRFAVSYDEKGWWRFQGAKYWWCVVHHNARWPY